MKLIFSITLIFFTALFFAVDIRAATFTVSNINDDGIGSLRFSVTQANATPEEDIIVFDAQAFGTAKTIALISGQINVTNSIIINGPGTNLLTISGNNQSRIFFSNFSSSLLSINNLTLTQGFAPNGGAIYTSCSLKLSNVVITGNTAMGAEVGPPGSIISLGGGIYSTGELVITDSIISNNTASGVVIQNTTNPNFGDYGTAGGGGGIYSSGFDPVIVNCTFINNIAKGADSPTAGGSRAGSRGGGALGGAIYGTFRFKIYNSTFTNNSAVGGSGGSISSNTFIMAGNGGEALGGAINSSSSIILNSLIYNNKTIAGSGGNAFNLNNAGNGGISAAGGIQDFDLKMANTTVADNKVIAGNGRIGGSGSAGGVLGGSNQWKIINSTITNNSVSGGTGTQSNGLSEGGGVYSGSGTGEASSFSNNIAAENSAASGADVFGTFLKAFNNLVGVGGGAANLTNGVNGNLVGTKDSPVNPMLAPLGSNGGITQTRALLPGSPAINAGNNSRAENPLTSQNLQFDQRGFQRIVPGGGVIDIGAFEFGASTVPAAAVPDLRDSSDTGLSQSDNITKATAPVFEILNVIPGARVELLRNNEVVSSAIAASLSLPSFSVSLTDSSPPLDGVVQYSSRQIIAGVTSAVSPSISVAFDNTAPTVTINRAASQTDPAKSLPIRFTAVFSEPVAGLDRQNVSLAGSTADITNAFIYVSAINASSYTIEVSGVRSPGQIVVTLPARAAYDLALNYSSPATGSDNSVNFQPNIISVAVSGRVRRNSGVIRTSSVVTLTDNLTGEIWTARTNLSGYYHFINLKIYEQIGSRFSVQISSKNFIYNAPQPLAITDNRGNLNFIVP